jgi:hypothetical protein
LVLKKVRTADGVSRRVFLWGLSAAWLGGVRRRVQVRALDHAEIARSATWAG